jgi:hypothetical protein
VPRPSDREIFSKILDAKDAILDGRRTIAIQKHLAGDLEDLALDSTAELWDLLPFLLDEIVQANPLHCYAGGRPPHRSYEEAIKGLELWAYCWPSARLQKTMYLKFALQKDVQGNWHFMHVDLHESRI